MLLSSRSPITRLLTVLSYAATAGAGQSLHLLAGHDHGHQTIERAMEAGRCDVPARSPSVTEKSNEAADDHDADHCPICQYHSQGQWHRPREGAATSAPIAFVRHHDVGQFFQRSLNRPLGPRGPPSSSAPLSS